MQKAAFFGNRDNCSRVIATLSGNRRTFKRVERNINGSSACADFFTDVEHRRFVALAFADHDLARNQYRVKCLAHCVHGRLVGDFFIALTHLPGCSKRSGFGNANKFEG